MADFWWEDWKHDDATGIDTGRNFRYVEGDTTVTGAAARYNDRTKLLDAEGNLVMEDPKHRVTAEKANVDRKKKLAILTGSVVLTLKPKDAAAPPAPNDSPPPAGKGAVGLAPIQVPGKMPPSEENRTEANKQEDADQARRRGGTATCDRLEDYYRKKFVILRGNLIFKQKFMQDGKEIERTVTAEHAEYDGKKEILVLFAPVHMTDTEGSVMDFESNVTISTKEGAETMQSTGKIKGSRPIEEEGEGDGEAAATPPPANPPAAPAPPAK
jgi:lipopolysaccharide export system protein LptA